jgi:hypothetical protein
MALASVSDSVGAILFIMPEQPDHRAPDQSAKIDHHRQTSADSLTLARGCNFAVGTV